MKARTVLINALIVAASLVVSVAGFEIYLRATGFSYPSFYQFDPEMGRVLRPSVAGLQEQEGHAYVTVNSHGFRDRERGVAKPAGVYRVAVIGASYVEALQVPLENAFWSIMERRLGSCARFINRPVQVLGFGVSGYASAQDFLVLKRIIGPYSPDLIVLAFNAGNDVNNNSKALSLDPLRPFFVVRNGELVLDDSFHDLDSYKRRSSWPWRTLRSISDHVRLVQFANKLRAIIQTGAEQGTAEARDDAMLAPPKSPDEVAAWNVTERIIAAMAHNAAAGGADFLVAQIPDPLEVNPDPKVRNAEAAKLGVNDLFYGERRLSAFGQQNGIKVLPLAYPLLRYAEEKHAYLHGFDNTGLGEGHWNALGHRVAGEVIAKAICDGSLE